MQGGIEDDRREGHPLFEALEFRAEPPNPDRRHVHEENHLLVLVEGDAVLIELDDLNTRIEF